jgi:hypothetical protein
VVLRSKSRTTTQSSEPTSSTNAVQTSTSSSKTPLEAINRKITEKISHRIDQRRKRRTFVLHVTWQHTKIGMYIHTYTYTYTYTHTHTTHHTHHRLTNSLHTEAHKTTHTYLEAISLISNNHLKRPRESLKTQQRVISPPSNQDSKRICSSGRQENHKSTIRMINDYLFCWISIHRPFALPQTPHGSAKRIFKESKFLALGYSAFSHPMSRMNQFYHYERV